MTLYTKSGFAELIGRSPGYVTQHISKGNIVLTPGTDKIDITHPTNNATAINNNPNLEGFLPEPESKHRTQRQEGAVNRQGRRKKYQGELANLDDDPIPAGDPIHALKDRVDIAVEDLLNMTLMQIYRRYGTLSDAIAYIDSVKKIEDIVYKQTKTATERAQLVSREAVMGLFAAIDEAHARMLSDAPATIAGLVHSMMESSPTKEEIEEIVREPMSKELATAKNKVQRNIRKMKRKLDDDADDD